MLAATAHGRPALTGTWRWAAHVKHPCNTSLTTGAAPVGNIRAAAIVLCVGYP